MDSNLIVPVIALAEACWIIEHGRTSIPTVTDFLVTLDADPREIVATALLLIDKGETVAVLTRDENIRRSGFVSAVW